MNKLIRFAARMDIGFFLLVAASVLLSLGAVITDFNPAALKKLNFITFQDWFPQYYRSPLLYVWILLLFATLFSLAANTFVCTVMYVKNTVRSGMSARRWGIVMLHICFLIFFSGHFLYGFTGVSENAVAEKGLNTDLPEVGLSVVPLSIERKFVTVYGEDIPMVTKAEFTVTDSRGRKATVHPATLRPGYALGYSFHISMTDKGLTDLQTGIIVRRDYGRYLFAAGGIVALVAILLYIPSLLRPRLGQILLCNGIDQHTGT